MVGGDNMSYNDTPLPTDLISDSQPDIRENFLLLEDAQIVEHNLNVDDPDNGYYVRWENGLQVCFYKETINLDTTDERHVFDYPASFSTHPGGAIILENDSPGEGSSERETTFKNFAFAGKACTSSNWAVRTNPDNDYAADIPFGVQMVAIGRWK